MADLKQFAEQLVNLTVKEELATTNWRRVRNWTSCCNCSSIRCWWRAAEEVQTEFTLKEAGASKLAVVKMVKELTGLGLRRLKM
jgi:large subunit ribosomal protein L7/L12